MNNKIIMSILMSVSVIATPAFCINDALQDSQAVEQAIVNNGHNKISEESIKDYILKNPEIILQSLQNYEEKLQSQEESALTKLIKDNAQEIYNDRYSLILGNPDGKIEMAYFHDFRCGYCKRSWSNVLRLIEKNKDLKVVIKDLPILGEDSVLATKIAMAAAKQGKHKEMSDAFMEHRGSWNEDILLKLAKENKLDVKKLEEDIKTREIYNQIKQNLDLAEKLNIQGTPNFAIGDNLVEGAVPYDMLQEIVTEIRLKMRK